MMAFFFGVLTMAQKENEELRDYPGHATYKYSKFAAGYDYAQAFTPQEEISIKTKLESITGYLKGKDLISGPKGVEIILTGMISEKAPLSEWNKKLVSDLTLTIFPWFIKDGKPDYHCIECEVAFTIHINRPDLVFNGTSIAGGSDIFDTDGIVMNLEPELFGEQDGCKVYGNGIIIISKNEPVWIPVTVRDYDEALIRKYEKLNKENPGEVLGNNFFISKIREEMASFPEKELNAPAFTGDKLGGCPYKLESSQARAIVKLNPRYFDKAKPRTAAELIIISSFYIAPSDNTEFYPTNEYSSYQMTKLVEILKSLKYSELRKFFD